MKTLFLSILIFFTAVSYAHDKTACLIALNKSEFIFGENIIITFFTIRDNETFERLLSGYGTTQIFKNGEIIYERKMSPVSAPKREKDKGLSFYHVIRCDKELFSANSGYTIKAISTGWSSEEKELIILPMIVASNTQSEYEMLFKEYKAIVEPFVLQKSTKEIEALSDKFVKKYSKLKIAEIYIWNTGIETIKHPLFNKTYIKSSKTNNIIAYPKIHYTNPRAINIRELEQDGQKYIMIKQELGTTEYRMIIFVDE